MSKTKKILVVGDPVERWSLVGETSFFLTAEACRRGFEIYACTVDQLAYADGTVQALARRLVVEPKKQLMDEFRFRWEGEAQKIICERMDGILMRKDPPVDMTYIHHMHLMTMLEGRVPFCNKPSAVLRWNEKIAILQFADRASPTRVAIPGGPWGTPPFDPLIRKDLDDAQGRAVTLHKGAAEISKSEKENSGRGFFMDQPYNERIVEGDKRILIIDGEPIAHFVRVPAEGKYLANLRHGAKVVACDLTPREIKLSKDVGRWTLDNGIYLAGLDIIGECLSEINSTSVRGILEFMRTGGRDVSVDFWDRFFTSKAAR